MKLTISKSKNSATFYVQKSIRKSNGSVSSVTIEKLGNLDQVRARANGADPYQWAQEYVNELNRKEYEEQKSVMISRSPVKLMKKGDAHSFNCGYLFLQRIYYDLGLDKICRSSHNHQFNWWFTLGPDKGRLLLPPKGGMLQACYWSTTKWYYSLLSSIRHSALQCTFLSQIL